LNHWKLGIEFYLHFSELERRDGMKRV
jgi:hypothetical protein